jgi:hypothetical protein
MVILAVSAGGVIGGRARIVTLVSQHRSVRGRGKVLWSPEPFGTGSRHIVEQAWNSDRQGLICRSAPMPLGAA